MPSVAIGYKLSFFGVIMCSTESAYNEVCIRLTYPLIARTCEEDKTHNLCRPVT